MITGGFVGTSTAPGGRPAAPAAPLLTRPGFVLVVVLATWTAVPSLVADPKLTWSLTAALLALVVNALWRHLRNLRWTTPVTLLAVVLACGLVSTLHFGTLTDLMSNGGTALLVLGCALLAAHCDRADLQLLVRGVVLLALVELAVATASALFGMPAPWGYLGTPGSTFETNPLLPAVGGRATGSMSHPIPFGTLMAVAAVLCVPRLAAWRLPVRLGIAAACCAGVALSGSRSAALALGLALLATVLIPGILRISPAWRTVAVLAVTGALIAVDAAELPVVAGLQGTGSLTHRLAALDAAGRLADRSPAQTLFGSGQGSLRDLFDAGLLQRDGFFAVDNQLVTTFAVAGLAGVVALVAAVAVSLLRGHRSSRPAALLMVVMFGSFDVLEWTATAVLVAVLMCLRTRRRPDGEADLAGSSTAAGRSMLQMDPPPQHRTR